MNWVGGVRRRVLQRDEVRRRQDIFFAVHALPAQKPASGIPAERPHDTNRTHHITGPSSGPLASRRRISPRKWRSEELVCERLKRGHTWDNYSSFLHKKKQNWSGVKHIAEPQPAREGHTRVAKTSKASLVRPASIHGPFSRYLLRLELQSVGLKLEEGEEKSGLCKNQGVAQSRPREQRKERSSREGRLAREGTAPDRKRGDEEPNVQTLDQEENAGDKPEHQDVKTRKKQIRTKCTVPKPKHKTPKSKAPKDHDERNINPGNKELRRDSLKNTCSEKNKHNSMKTPERTHCSKGSRIKRQASASSQTNAHIKSREMKVKSSENTEHREHHNNIINDKAYTPSIITSKDPKADVDTNESDIHTSWRNSDRKQQEQKSSKRVSERKSSDKEGRHSMRRHKGSNLLAGAPRLRQVLSLTPDRHKGRIWAPLNLSSDSKDNVKPNEATGRSSHDKQNLTKNMNQVGTEEAHCEGNNKSKQETRKNNDTKERSRALCKTGRSKSQREWEEARLAMLLGPQFKSSSDNDKDKQKDKDNGESNGTVGMSDYQLTQRFLDPPVTQDKSSHTTNKSLTSPDSPESEHIREAIPETNKSEAPKKDHLNTKRPKLSTFTRKIYKIESGLSFARERKDKTPYLDKSFGTPWLGGAIFNTSGSSFSSSRTPTDPTLERSCEDPFGSQGAELHTNTTIYSITNAQNQEQGKK